MTATEWLDYARRHLRTARVLLESAMLEDALFHTHQAIELSLKAVLLRRSARAPPRIHSLKRLANLAGFGHAERFAELDPIYVGTRYPDKALTAPVRAVVVTAIRLAEEVIQWSNSQLK